MKSWDPFISKNKILRQPIKQSIEKKQIKEVKDINYLKQVKYVKQVKQIKPLKDKARPQMNLFAKLLLKCVLRNFKLHFSFIKAQQANETNLMKKIIIYVNKNQQTCKLLAWQSLKRYSYIKNTNKNLSRSFINLTHRINQYILAKAFKKILIFSYIKMHLQISNIVNNRTEITINILKRLVKNRNKYAFKKLKARKQKFKKMQSKLYLMGILIQRLSNKTIRSSFNQIIKYSSINIENKASQDENLKIQLDDMTIQLQNKNENINRLNQQLNSIKQEIALQQQNANISAISKRSGESYDKKSNSYQRKDSRSDFKGERDYSQISQEYSFGSLLGSSFVSFKSRASRSALESAEGDCNCQFRYRYYQYKSLHQTLKNQLQIVKKELQVAKDLNDHFENELKSYGDNEDHEQIQKTKNQIKEAQRQRDSLRQKYIKYKDYSNTLKTDFKKKMEAIYRKLRRQ